MVMQRQNDTARVETWSKQAGRRGGDFIVRHVTPFSVTVILGDAMGHGDSAAELAAFARHMFSRDMRLWLSEPLFRHWHHNIFSRFGEDQRFVCFTALELQLPTRRLTVVNAGNPDVLIHRDTGHRIERFGSTGMPLGVLNEEEWQPPTLQWTWLGRSDYAFCISDGVIDRLGPGRQRFGMRRVCTAARLAGGPSVLYSLRRGLLRFGLQCPEQDDLSLLFLGLADRRVA